MPYDKSDLKKIEELIEIMKANDLDEIEIKHGDDKIFLKRAAGRIVQVTNQTSPPLSYQTALTAGSACPPQIQNPQGTSDTITDLVPIKSPLVGTFYAQPSPDSEPFVELGSAVNSQTVVCIIEAMKVMNEIKAETSGTIVEILVENGQAIEYGQVLFKIKPE